MTNVIDSLSDVVDEQSGIAPLIAEDPTPRHSINLETMRAVQYLFIEGGYWPCGATVGTLPSDIYQLQKTNDNMRLIFKPMQMSTDTLIHFKSWVLQDVLDDMNGFLKAQEQYQYYGLSHKRGYLLHGLPGTGKSCLVRLMMQDVLKNNGIVLCVEHIYSVLQGLQEFRRVEPNRLVVLVMEDIDGMLQHQSANEPKLLAMMDGELQVANVIFIGTTNYPEILDKRFLNRPGRFDRVVRVEVPNIEIRKQYLMNKAHTVIAPDGTDLLSITDKLSLGHLRELIVDVFINKKPAQDVVQRLQGMSKKPSRGGGADMGFELHGKYDAHQSIRDNEDEL